MTILIFFYLTTFITHSLLPLNVNKELTFLPYQVYEI